MSGRKRFTRVGGVAIALLAALCFLGPATHGQIFGWRTAVVGSSPVSNMLPEEIHEHAKSSVSAAATRIRQQPSALSLRLPVAVYMSALLGAALLALLVARGSLFSRAPDNFGRQRLITLGIDRR